MQSLVLSVAISLIGLASVGAQTGCCLAPQFSVTSLYSGGGSPDIENLYVDTTNQQFRIDMNFTRPGTSPSWSTTWAFGGSGQLANYVYYQDPTGCYDYPNQWIPISQYCINGSWAYQFSSIVGTALKTAVWNWVGDNETLAVTMDGTCTPVWELYDDGTDAATSVYWNFQPTINQAVWSPCNPDGARQLPENRHFSRSIFWRRRDIWAK